MTAMLIIDARGMLCPLPVLRLRKVLAGMPRGGKVTLLATDSMALVDVPHFCDEAGHAIVATRHLAGGDYEFVVASGNLAPSAARGPTAKDS